MAAPDVSALARKFRIDVDTSLTPTPTWTQIKGVMEFKADTPANLEDDSDYDSEGWQSQTKTALAWVNTLKVVRRRDPADVTDYDAGQEALRAKAYLFGEDGVAHVRWYDRDGGPEAYEGYAEVAWAPEGGAMTALELVTITLTGRGKRLDLDNPNAASSS